MNKTIEEHCTNLLTKIKDPNAQVNMNMAGCSEYSFFNLELFPNFLINLTLDKFGLDLHIQFKNKLESF